jgi:hypothetical protein
MDDDKITLALKRRSNCFNLIVGLDSYARLALWQIRWWRRELLVRQFAIEYQPCHFQAPANVHLQVTVHEPHTCTRHYQTQWNELKKKERDVLCYPSVHVVDNTDLGCRHGNGWQPSRRRAHRRCCARRGRRD